MQWKSLLLEFYAILSVLTFKRVTNLLRVLFFYILSRITKKVYSAFDPLAISIEPINVCNLKCPECPTGVGVLKRARGQMTLEKYKHVLNHLGSNLIYLNLYVQGESMMHPHFAQMVQMAREKGYYTSCSTNGHYINDEIAERLVVANMTRLIFSVDGLTQNSYEKYRKGGDLHVVLEGIRNVVAAKKKHKSRFPIVVMQFLVFEHNEHELFGVRAFAKDLNVDKLEIKSAQFNLFGNKKVKQPVNARLNRYIGDGSFKLKSRLRNHCWRQWHSAIVTWKGEFCPCCYDKHAKYVLGNVFEGDLQSIFKGENSLNFKKQIIREKSLVDMCLNCPEGRSFLP